MTTNPDLLKALIQDSSLLPQAETLEIKRKKGYLYQLGTWLRRV